MVLYPIISKSHVWCICSALTNIMTCLRLTCGGCKVLLWLLWYMQHAGLRRGGERGRETVNCSKYEPHTSCICVLTWHGAAAWRIGVLRMSVSIRVIFNLIWYNLHKYRGHGIVHAHTGTHGPSAVIPLQIRTWTPRLWCKLDYAVSLCVVVLNHHYHLCNFAGGFNFE